jgi:DNA topoisomerase-3
VKVMADLEARIARLGEDEKRLFALVCRSYLAAVMPDHEYRRTTVRMDVAGHEFRAVGRITLKPGWRAVYGPGDPEGGGRAGEGREAEGPLPPLRDGEVAALGGARVEAKRTQAPPRYGEGALIDAMQNAWRFVEDPAQRERLKEAKGIGTPATRAAIIEGLKRQGLLAPSGKWIVPTEAGLELHALLSGAAPALVDPGTTALWELRLDGILRRAGEVRPVVDAIAAEAARLIEVLKGQSGRAIAPAPGSPGAKAGKRAGRRRGTRAAAAPRAGEGRARRTDPGQVPGGTTSMRPTGEAARRPPTERMLGFARSLARERKLDLPEGVETDYDACRRFLDAHAPTRPSGGAGRRAAARRPAPEVRPEPGGAG